MVGGRLLFTKSVILLVGTKNQFNVHRNSGNSLLDTNETY